MIRKIDNILLFIPILLVFICCIVLKLHYVITTLINIGLYVLILKFGQLKKNQFIIVSGAISFLYGVVLFMSDTFATHDLFIWQNNHIDFIDGYGFFVTIIISLHMFVFLIMVTLIKNDFIDIILDDDSVRDENYNCNDATNTISYDICFDEERIDRRLMNTYRYDSTDNEVMDKEQNSNVVRVDFVNKLKY